MYVCVDVSVCVWGCECVCLYVGGWVCQSALPPYFCILSSPPSLTPSLIPPSLSSYPPFPILTSHTHHTSSPLLSHTLTLTSFFPHTPHLHPPHPHPPHPLPPSQVRASSELERQQVVSEVRRQAEAEKEIAIAETKKKKWVKRPLMCCV